MRWEKVAQKRTFPVDDVPCCIMDENLEMIALVADDEGNRTLPTPEAISNTRIFKAIGAEEIELPVQEVI